MTVHSRPWLAFIKTLLGLALCVLLLFACLMGYVWYCAQERPITPAPATIVLGAAAWGHKPSPVFKERIRHAVHLYQSHTTQKLIFTGGALRADIPSEGEVGARWAIRLGVAPEDTAYEATSRDTWFNLKNANVILQQAQIDSVILVSDYFHLARAGIMARDLGLQVQLSPTPTSKFNNFSRVDKFNLYLKESYFIIGHQLRKLFESDFYQAELTPAEAATLSLPL
ncbi:MAG: YdcF family protein [Pseudomonas sp.]|jgi:uncharacterized SAM-binding protein YcdF (DUF218 family)|nr:YdcF family protein [Pseudomonas sp.]